MSPSSKYDIALATIDDWPVGHAAVGVTSSGGPVASRGRTSLQFPLASVTKPLVAYAALVAIEEGTIDLDQPAGPDGSTIRHLLAHASGLPFEGAQPVARPGTRRIYSNTGFELLADEIAGAAGMAIERYLGEAVLQPLGMTRTSLAGSPAKDGVGTVDDLLAFATDLLAPTLVSPETLAEARTVVFPGLAGILPGIGRQDPNDWGLGFELRDSKHPHWTGTRNSPNTFGHFGASGTFLWVDPDAGLAMACLTDHAFGEWALREWPKMSDAVLSH